MAPLLGPPETPLQPSAGDPSSNSGDPFVDLMTAHFNATNPPEKPPMGLTENSSPTFLSTGNPCLDFFFHVVPDTPPETLVDLLNSAWTHDPLATLKLICHLRGVRGTGKSDKEGFYTAALWLHQRHPKTLALNLKQISRFGYLKDMPEILFRQLAGNDARKIAKAERKRSKPRRYKGRFKRRAKSTVKKSAMQKMLKGFGSGTVSPEAARNLRHKKIAELARKAIEKYNRDPDYKFLHDRVSDLFSELLVSDLQALKSGNLQRIGLAAKWCPSLDSSFDKWTLLCESIARRVFPRESDSEYRDLEERFYAFRVRDRLRKEILVPLRQALELPEVYMSAKRWDALPYNRVASVAMKNYKSLFRKHDPERFGQFLEQVREGKAKIAAGALLPHEILADAEDDVADLQWKRMVSDLSKKGKLTNCIAVCDVSGSMFGTPIDVCVALGILISDLCEDPWKGKVITFSATPQIHLIKGETLKEKVEFVRNMEWGMNTNFQKVFDIILEGAVNGRLLEEKMIKRVFVFSDMEFDQASENKWETDYEGIKRKFSERGYSRAPEVVFWNLRDSRATPVAGEEKGVAMVSGFSKNLLNLFLEEGGVINPKAVMEMAIAGDEFKELVVFD